MIKNRKYTKTKKNGGEIPTVTDRRTEYVPVGCGNCIECRKQKAREWQIRLMEDIKTHKNGHFITLTFNNESINKLLNETIKKTNKETGEIQTVNIQTLSGYNKDNAIATKAVRLFNERWRKKHKKAIRHWLVTELGHNGTENIHLHGIIWTDKPEQIAEIWQYGYVWPNKKTKTWVSNQTINYIVKYINKIDEKHKEYKSIILTSPGIGADFIKTQQAKKTETTLRETYITPTGHQISLPIYWRNKLFTDETKERLWINRLDKQERWILGQKIDISKGDKAYISLLNLARQKNQQLGYGNRPNENRKQYEEQRREIMIQTRLKQIQKGAPSARS